MTPIEQFFADHPEIAHANAMSELDTLRASNAQLLAALELLQSKSQVCTDWMREFTGPHDGTLTMLTDWHYADEIARAAIAQAKGSG